MNGTLIDTKCPSADQPLPQRYRTITRLAGMLALPLVWVFLTYVVGVSQRYLPAPDAVMSAVADLGGDFAIHSGITVFRVITGFFVGSALGVVIGILLYRSRILHEFLNPSLQALRSVPPIATIPFFLLWFGFSEWGKILLITFGVSINLAIVAYQILQEKPDKYRYALHALGLDDHHLPWGIALPLVMERLLPTLRFSLAVSLGLVITSELLGSQYGLGYLIQASRSTFAIHVILLCTIVLGIVNAIADSQLVRLWGRLIFWRPRT